MSNVVSNRTCFESLQNADDRRAIAPRQRSAAGQGNRENVARIVRRRVRLDARGRAAFTLVEVAVATLISSIVLMSAATIWQGFGRSVAACVAEAELASNLRLAMESLRQDFGGSLQEATEGPLGEGKLVGRVVIGEQLRLCFDMPPVNGAADWTAPDEVVVYEVVGGRLLRTRSAGATFVVAEHVSDFHAERHADTTEIFLTLEHRSVQRTMHLIAQDK